MNIGDLIKTITGSELGIIISEIDMTSFSSSQQIRRSDRWSDAGLADYGNRNNPCLYYRVYNFEEKKTIIYGSRELKVFKKAPVSNIL